MLVAGSRLMTHQVETRNSSTKRAPGKRVNCVAHWRSGVAVTTRVSQKRYDTLHVVRAAAAPKPRKTLVSFELRK